MAKASKGKAREQPQPESAGSSQGGLGLGMEERVASISSEEINVLIYCVSGLGAFASWMGCVGRCEKFLEY